MHNSKIFLFFDFIYFVFFIIFSKVLLIFTIIFSFFGTITAIRHVYLEKNPPETFDCIADVGFLMENFPLTKTLPMIFMGKRLYRNTLNNFGTLNC